MERREVYERKAEYIERFFDIKVTTATISKDEYDDFYKGKFSCGDCKLGKYDTSYFLKFKFDTLEQAKEEIKKYSNVYLDFGDGIVFTQEFSIWSIKTGWGKPFRGWGLIPVSGKDEFIELAENVKQGENFLDPVSKLEK